MENTKLVIEKTVNLNEVLCYIFPLSLSIFCLNYLYDVNNSLQIGFESSLWLRAAFLLNLLFTKYLLVIINKILLLYRNNMIPIK